MTAPALNPVPYPAAIQRRIDAARARRQAGLDEARKCWNETAERRWANLLVAIIDTLGDAAEVVPPAVRPALWTVWAQTYAYRLTLSGLAPIDIHYLLHGDTWTPHKYSVVIVEGKRTPHTPMEVCESKDCATLDDALLLASEKVDDYRIDNHWFIFE